MCLRFDAKLPAILKFGNMESQKRPRSEHNDTSLSKTFPRIAIPIHSETKEAVKLHLSEGKKKAERVDLSPKPGQSTSEGIQCTQRKENPQARGEKAQDFHRFDSQ